MNETRRKKLRSIVHQLENVQGDIENVLDEEDEARENMPESLQETDRYTTSEEASEAMDMSIDSIGEAISAIEDII